MQMTRQLIAMLLLICVGILVPLSATPVRVCLLDADTAGVLVGHDPEKECCPECSRGSETPEPCCVDVEEFPDSTSPQNSFELPSVVLTDLTELLGPSPLNEEIQSEVVSTSEPIRGPTSPAAHRAVLGIWTL
jgi:hypothetical protein